MMRMVDLTPTATGYLTVMIFINAYYIIVVYFVPVGTRVLDLFVIQ